MKSLLCAESVLRAYEHAMDVNVLQSSLDGFELVVMAWAACVVGSASMRKAVK